MKKVLFAMIALISFSAASFAQTAPTTKKKEPAKTHVAKKAHHKANKAAKKPAGK